MAATTCGNIRLADAYYPPLRLSDQDIANQQAIDKLKAEAPFGRSRTGNAITPWQYANAMREKAQAFGAVDFRWPFWVGMGLGVVGVIVAARK